MKRLIVIAILITLCCAVFLPTKAYVAERFLMYHDGKSYGYNDLPMLHAIVETYEKKAMAAQQIIESMKTLGYDETHEIVKFAEQELFKAEVDVESYRNIYKTLVIKWEIKQERYPEATYVWERLKKAGYSDIICAGIMGNIMAEVGGQTLDINPYLYGGNKRYYGMCQWDKVYCKEVYGASLEEQCDYLIETIEKEFNTFGSNYDKNFNYKKFTQLSDIRDAAAAFARCYERCHSDYYTIRERNAVVAYNYFVS